MFVWPNADVGWDGAPKAETGWLVGAANADRGGFPPPENADCPNAEFVAPAVEPNAEPLPLAKAAKPPPPLEDPPALAACANALGAELDAPNAVAGLTNADCGCGVWPNDDCPKTDVGATGCPNADCAGAVDCPNADCVGVAV